MVLVNELSDGVFNDEEYFRLLLVPALGAAFAARAASILNPDPTADANRKVAVNNKLIAYYKTRHQGSDAGLAELIFTVMSQPIPLPSH